MWRENNTLYEMKRLTFHLMKCKNLNKMYNKVEVYCVKFKYFITQKAAV